MHSHGAAVAAVALVVRSTWARGVPATHPSQTLPGALLDNVRRIPVRLPDGLRAAGGHAVFSLMRVPGRHGSKGAHWDTTAAARRKVDAFAETPWCT